MRLLSACLFLLLTLSACRRDDIPEVQPEAWACRSNGTCELRLEYRRMNPDAIRDGGLAVYMEEEFNSERWFPLPHVFFRNGYQEFYDYEFEQGFVYVYLSRSDGRRPENPPLRRFRLVYVAPEDWRPAEPNNPKPADWQNLETLGGAYQDFKVGGE